MHDRSDRYLLYCIFRRQGHQLPGALTGVDGQPVILVACNGLRAAISRATGLRRNLSPLPSCSREEGSDHGETLTAEIPRLLAFKRVVEALHGDPAVSGIIPMRYGILFDGQSHVRRLLDQRRKQYEALLSELDDCVEFGIRFLLTECTPAMQDADPGPVSAGSGADYLAARRACYARTERFNQAVRTVTDRWKEEFSGLFTQCKVEHQGAVNLFSLYFLVPGGSVESFREAFGRMICKTSFRCLLSGPWPPYNFV